MCKHKIIWSLLHSYIKIPSKEKKKWHPIFTQGLNKKFLFDVKALIIWSQKNISSAGLSDCQEKIIFPLWTCFLSHALHLLIKSCMDGPRRVYLRRDGEVPSSYHEIVSHSESKTSCFKAQAIEAPINQLRGLWSTAQSIYLNVFSPGPVFKSGIRFFLWSLNLNLYAYIKNEHPTMKI